MDKKKILIVEDEADIRELLRYHLEREGFEVLEAGDGPAGLTLARTEQPALMLLDVMLPGMDGFDVLRGLATENGPAVPVLLLTARGEEVDRVVGLTLGADDYVVKPFSVRELMLRVKAILRRQDRAQTGAVLRHHGITLDAERHRASVNEEPVVLTATEFRLLEDLLRHSGAVRTREQLLNTVWGYSFEGYARTVDTHVRRLRAKLGAASAVIETVRGVGYRLKED